MTTEVDKLRAAQEGDLRVWWIPQVGMDRIFYVPVDTRDQGLWLQAILADYDNFQFENKIKPDYCNVGGLEVFEDGEWCEAEDE